ncbi:GNAT family N-acyltransferase [Thalassotalea agariperforans]
MFNTDQVIEEQLPKIKNNKLLFKPVRSILKFLLHEKECQSFAEQYPHLEGIDFVEQVLDYFDFSYSVLDKEKSRIPSSGRVVIIANHPIGSLDGLALLKFVSDIRPDVKAIANDLLMTIKPLEKSLLPVNNMKGNTPKENLNNIYSYLNNDGAVIIFPAGEVSRLKPNGVKDGQWHSGFYRMAKATKSPIVPIFVDGKNSAIFYSASMIYKPLATMLLMREMFKQKKKTVALRIGEGIPYENYANDNLPTKTKVKLFHKHLYRIAHNKTGIFKTQSAIAFPEQRQTLKKALKQCQHLGSTNDGKDIYLYNYDESSPILREIGRLREVAFRAVGEGTGKKRDIDKYDAYYHHLILWDKEELEIIGAYRFADTKKVINTQGKDALYTETLFKYENEMNTYLEQGLELGRSFVQPKYWGKRSLDYLWFGIGAFLKVNPQFRYLFGPVSISDSYPPAAKDLMVYFYNLYFGYTTKVAESNQPYQYQQPDLAILKASFSGEDYKADFVQLKHLLANMGVSVPTLYKQYSELCQPGGVQFLAFGTDPEFQDCLDGLVLVDVTKFTDKKRARYLGED